MMLCFWLALAVRAMAASFARIIMCRRLGAARSLVILMRRKIKLMSCKKVYIFNF